MVTIFQDFSLDDATCASMFTDRKRLFVDLLDWDVPVLDGRFEIDAYDGPSATYLVATDEDGHHIGSMRLLPTEGPHILGDLFAGLCHDPVPRGACIFEITRLCLPTRLGAAQRLAVRNRLISAMVDHAHDHGIVAFTGVVSESFRSQVLAMGWRCAALGVPQPVAAQRLGAFRIDLDAGTRAALTLIGIYTPDTRRSPARQAA
ncbi:acyl-homoserine-lactone synthase [Sphingobium fuliginis]|uniref:Acyl-homoserine-lactone synthase n=1 Tax=Sphingobium fuliginis ATCC 27551 TaxID=1208342 RepID=A0A5B8CGT4_SPHSA|nr:acyl-homoserine-lactone synthase [Sphingobium fuliginis]QDC37237.1 autoinducer synthase [Sphingobium fuliginis ATCC 27551]